MARSAAQELAGRLGDDGLGPLGLAVALAMALEGDLFEVAEVYRDLYRLKSTKVLSFGERRMLDTARNLIVKELAVARRWSEEKAEKELEKATAA